MRIYIIFILLIAARFGFAGTFDEGRDLVKQTQAAKRHEASRAHQSSALKNLSENYYFVFFYKSTCPHCKDFAPILKDFSKHFQIEVIAYSFDERPIDGFESRPMSAELFQTFYVAGNYKPAVPALFLVNRHTLEAFAVLFGGAKDYELANRVNELLSHIEEKFHA